MTSYCKPKADVNIVFSLLNWRKIDSASMSRILRNFLPVAGIGLLCIAAYSNSFHVPFQFDDDRQIRFNFSLRDLKDWSGIVHSELFRPLTTLSFAVNFRMSQKDPISYHVVNLFLHLSNSLLFYFILTRLSVNRLYCWLSALLFALHPMNTEAVTYISGRSILLCAFFYLFALVSLDAHLRKPKASLVVLFFLFFLLGALSREDAALVPFGALLYNFLFFGSESVRRHKWLHITSVALVFFALLVRLPAEFEALGRLPYPVAIYWASELTVWLRYMGLALMPVYLNVDHGISPVTITSGFFWISLVVIGGLIATIAWSARKAKTLPAFWGAWFFLHLLASSVFPLNDLMAEHRLYLSMMGFCGGVGALLIWVQESEKKRPVILIAAFCGLAISSGAVTYARNRIWSSSATLWYDAVLKSPENFRPHLNLGYSLFQAGAIEDALQEYQIAQKLNPGIPRIYTGIGFCYLQRGVFSRAESNFRIALALDSAYVDAKTGLGIVAYRQNRYGDALSAFEQTLPYRQESPKLVAMMSVCYLQTQQSQKALELLRSKQELDSELGDAYRSLQNGQNAKALKMLMQASKL